MKYALIGCGRISVNHIAAAQANNVMLRDDRGTIHEKAEGCHIRQGA